MGCDRRQLDLVIHRMGMLLVGLYRAPTMWAGFGLGDDDLVRFRMQRPAPTRTSDTGLATCPRAWTWRTVRLRGMRGRHTRIVGILARRPRFGFECRQLGFQALHLRPECRDEGILFRLR